MNQYLAAGVVGVVVGAVLGFGTLVGYFVFKWRLYW